MLDCDEDSSRFSYDVLQRQSFRRFTTDRISVSDIAILLNRCEPLLHLGLTCLLYVRAGRCDAGIEGLYQYSNQEGPMLIPSATPVREKEVMELYTGDNQATFCQSAFALYFLGNNANSKNTQVRQLTQIGEVSQNLMSRSWSHNIGLCPIGQVEQELLNQLLGVAPEADNRLEMLHGFVGGAISPDQLSVWEPEGVAQSSDEHSFDTQPDALKAFLRNHLPAYMVPEVYVPVSEIPLSGNGKVDRDSLPSIDVDVETATQNSVGMVSPRNAIEALLQRLWQDLFSINTVSIRHNFFHLGGNSLLAMRMTSTLLNEHGIDVSLRNVFEEPTIEKLAKIIADSDPQVTTKPNIYKLAAEKEPSEDAERYPLTMGQQNLFAHHQTKEIKTAYNIVTALRIRGQFNSQRIQLTLQVLLDRHDALRTRFAYEGGELCQMIDASQGLHFEEIDLENTPKSDIELVVKQWIECAASHEFDLFHGPMLRCHLLRLSAVHHILILNVHHIVADYLSMDLFAKEMSFLYSQEHQPSADVLDPLGLQFSDFIMWQQAFLQSEQATEQKEYWRNKLSNMPRLEFPNEQGKTESADQKDGWLEYHCPSSTFSLIEDCCNEQGLTSFVVGLAALHQLLEFNTSQTDIVIGTPISNRFNHELENIVGLMLNTLVVRLNSAEQLSCGDFLAHVKQEVIEAFDNKDLPVEYVERELSKLGERDHTQKDLYRVRYVYRNVETQAQAPKPSLAIETMENERSQAKFDLLVTVNKSDNSLSGEFEYRDSAIDSLSASGMCNLYVTIMHYLCDNLTSSLADLKNHLHALEREQATEKISMQKRKKNNRLSKLARRKRRGLSVE